MMTDKDQKIVWEGEFLPFGEPLSITGTITNNLRFPGQYYDEETGLNYNYFRDYKPEIGRYLEADPIGLEGGMNLYSYTLNNPINFSDSIGLLIPVNLIPQIWCAYNEYRKGKNIKSSNDKYKHCVTSCYIGKKCGIDISLIMGFAKEIKDLLDMDPKTFADFADIVANVDGIACCFSSLGCEKCCECEKGYKP